MEGTFQYQASKTSKITYALNNKPQFYQPPGQPIGIIISLLPTDKYLHEFKISLLIPQDVHVNTIKAVSFVVELGFNTP